MERSYHPLGAGAARLRILVTFSGTSTAPWSVVCTRLAPCRTSRIAAPGKGGNA
jgi:hypothetical protein